MSKMSPEEEEAVQAELAELERESLVRRAIICTVALISSTSLRSRPCRIRFLCIFPLFPWRYQQRANQQKKVC